MIYLCVGIITGFVISFVLILMYKWGIMEILQANSRSRFIYMLLSCNFCIGFWVGAFIAVWFLITSGDPRYLMIPFVSSVLAKKMT